MRIEKPPRRRHGIGLTPLIDMVFILLVFFMLASNLTNWQALTLGTITAAPAAKNQPAPLEVVVSADGQLTLNGTRVTLSGLRKQVTKRVARASRPVNVVVRPRAGVRLDGAVQVLDTLAPTGAKSISLARAGS